MKKVYFDHASASPVIFEAVAEMVPFWGEIYGNPHNIHYFGQEALEKFEEAREAVSLLINSKKDEIIFTSCGTESNNMALKGLAGAYKNKKEGSRGHIITSSIEHLSVLNTIKMLEKDGFETTILPVDKDGLVSPNTLKDAIRENTILISIMHANNEIGTIQNLKELVQISKNCGVCKPVFHSDAVASVGQIPVDVEDLGVDALSFSAQSFYGPKGVGMLYVRSGIRILPMMMGGIQEGGKRPGTENLPCIAGAKIAAKLAMENMGDRAIKTSELRDRLIEGITTKIDNIYPTGHRKNRLPGQASFCVEFIEGEAMLLHLAMKGIAVSSGSACTSKALKASHVLLAIGVPVALAQGSIVITLGKDNSEEEIDYFIEVFPEIVDKLRKMSPLVFG